MKKTPDSHLSLRTPVKKLTTSFSIGIPTINRWDLLKPFLPVYKKDFPNTNLFIVDNGDQIQEDQDPLIRFYFGIVHRPASNMGVAASWNWLCETIFAAGHTHALILNDDVYLGASQRAVSAIINDKPWAFQKTLRDDWCAFILPKTIYENVGPFDERFFPCYFEDRDYMRRMRHKGCSIVQTQVLNPAIYKSSQSVEKDKSLLQNFEKNKQLYIAIWGGPPGQEKFSSPYNR